VHLHPGIVRFAWQAKGPHRFNLVSDAMSALGMPSGTYHLGDLEVMTDGTSARLADGRLAGSLLSLDQAVRNLVQFTGCSTEQAIATVTTVPASVLRLCASRGRIAPRYVADMVLLTHDLQVVATIAAGRVVYTDL
jgi:N-acetylglucosamine-6-phosphate deacetylase